MWNLFQRKKLTREPLLAESLPKDWAFTMALLTDPGCQRAVNQDRGRLLQSADESPVGRMLLAVIADGMGGHNGGEVASELAVHVICREFSSRDGALGESLARSVDRANRAIFDLASQTPELTGMGTTCTALVLAGGRGYVAHVGDSRLYLVRDRTIYQMTEDHSLVMDLVRKGLLSSEEARTHPERNVLNRALGRHPDVEVSGWDKPIPVQYGDHFVLCSDGLPLLLSDETIKDVVLQKAPAEACAVLVGMARSRNAPDNVTVAIVRVDDLLPDQVYLPETREVGVISESSNEPVE